MTLQGNIHNNTSTATVVQLCVPDSNHYTVFDLLTHDAQRVWQVFVTQLLNTALSVFH